MDCSGNEQREKRIQVDDEGNGRKGITRHNLNLSVD